MDNGSQQGTSQTITSAWRGNRALNVIADRLSRSATIALLLSPVGLLLISVTRLLIISDYNPTTASAIVSSSGYVNTLLGTIIPLVPIVMPYLALILLFFNRVILGALALLATAFISPTTMSRSAIASLAANDWHQIAHRNGIITAVIVLLTVVVALLLFIELFGISFNSFMRTIATMISIALIPTVVQLYPLPIKNTFYAQLIRQPWLPAETITLRSGGKFIGYVLSDSGTWIEVLRDDTRTISYYLTSDITRRQICQIEHAQATHPLITVTPAGTTVGIPTPTCQITSVTPIRPPPPISPPIPVKGPKP
jgi:hypothetical protein